jgi:hypothetical protein
MLGCHDLRSRNDERGYASAGAAFFCLFLIKIRTPSITARPIIHEIMQDTTTPRLKVKPATRYATKETAAQVMA